MSKYQVILKDGSQFCVLADLWERDARKGRLYFIRGDNRVGLVELSSLSAVLTIEEDV